MIPKSKQLFIMVTVFALAAFASADLFTDTWGDFVSNQANGWGTTFTPAKAVLAGDVPSPVPQTIYLMDWTFAKSSSLGGMTAGNIYLLVFEAAAVANMNADTLVGVSTNTVDCAAAAGSAPMTWSFDYVALDKETQYACMFSLTPEPAGIGVSQGVELEVGNPYAFGGFIRVGEVANDWDPDFVATYSTTPTPNPSLEYPTNNLENVATNVTLSWSAPNGYVPLGYNVFVDKGEPNLVPALAAYSSSGQPGLTYTPNPELEAGTTYYWRVEALEPNTVPPYMPIANSSPVWAFATQPESVIVTASPAGQAIAAGETAVLTVAALNGETYQWSKDGTPLSDAGKISGSTTDTLTITDFQMADEGLYACTISNSLPSSAISDPGRVMVQRLIARWTLDGTLGAVESNPAENWDAQYMDINLEQGLVPSTEEVIYVTGANGVAGSAVRFTGLSLALVPDSNDFFNFHQGGLTLTGWIKGPAGDNARSIIYKANAYETRQWAGGAVEMNLAGGSGWTTAVPAAEASQDEYSKWHFIAMTYDPAASERVVYGAYDEDGVFDILHTTAVQQADTAVGITSLLIGGSQVSGSSFNYLGSVDDIRIYNYPLTQTQIADVYREMNSNWICMGISEMDTTGPQGVPDCRVDIYEIAEIGLNWLNCGRMPESACSQ